MTVRANWYLDAPEADSEIDVEALGTPIDLSDTPTLNKKLVAYLEAEAVLARQGVTCPVKDRPDTTCSACPIRSTDDEDPLSRLCKIGCGQERVLTVLAIHERRPGDAPPAG